MLALIDCVNVNASMQINRFAFYNDVESTLDYQVLLEFEWIDPRLRAIPDNCNISDLILEGNDFHYSRIWSPNIRIARNKDTNVLKSSSLSQLIFLRFNTHGHVRVRLRYQQM